MVHAPVVRERCYRAPRLSVGGLLSLDLSALRELGEETLGRKFADYFGANDISPFESPCEILSDADFLKKWYRETHDLHHLVTGYSTDNAGELELQAFILGNLGLRECVMIIVLATLFQPHKLTDKRHLPARLVAAYKRGKAARSLFSVRFDKRFGEPLSVVQGDLGLAGSPS